MTNVHFLTGWPGFLGRRLLERLLEVDRKSTVAVLVQPRFAKDAKKELLALPRPKSSRVRMLVGDIVDMHLGLSGDEYRSLTSEVTRIFHLAAASQLAADRRALERVNVVGTRNVLELAADSPNLVRFGHVSTVQVAGDRQGVVDEAELEEGQRFRNAYEETKFRAEVIVRKAMSDLPITVFRPSTIIGDSRTGEVDRLGGPYSLALQLVTSPLRVPVPLPGDGSFPLNVVPSDFVADAMLELARKPEAVGKTFHLVDPNPMSARKVYERIAEMAGRKPLRLGLSAKASAALFRLPVIERIVGGGRTNLDHLNQIVIFNCRNTLELLDGTGIRCPPLDAYLDRLVGRVRQQVAAERTARLPEAAIDDPLAPAEPAQDSLASV
ncbi:SDR family oxidoreductase [Vulgatibacter incomptus]|uniref:Sorbitol-6-phosphate 2-dehydrogenase n=1 Tax=Vulgatibacter incomptus TaxID=1391653 RepID=A0A0K1P9K6_9BACT|nr:SDR family oxidoreductase [Vulgatibacter incomptus]AKU89784.1 Sorbitol-6-phosphate 2-dehydrogenase [Vulgatibacter incomptus]